jgi:hypothetical protein
MGLPVLNPNYKNAYAENNWDTEYYEAGMDRLHAVRHGHRSSVDTFGAIHIHICAISVSMHGYTDLSTDYPWISTHHPQTSKILNFCMFLRSF